VHRGYECTGVDASSKAVAIADSLTVSDMVRYLCLDIERDDLTLLGRYSLITCKYVYAFMEDKASFLRRVTTLLDTDGIFAIITPLTSDVDAERRSIAVDFDQTMEELHRSFASVETYAEQGATCFVCTSPRGGIAITRK
jgi:2-polyprenyl-3-methyl-5-hydroxy-6-metoxy-1,4-benzoquinol methylase